jgi:hypothetical protein
MTSRCMTSTCDLYYNIHLRAAPRASSPCQRQEAFGGSERGDLGSADLATERDLRAGVLAAVALLGATELPVGQSEQRRTLDVSVSSILKTWRPTLSAATTGTLCCAGRAAPRIELRGGICRQEAAAVRAPIVCELLQRPRRNPVPLVVRRQHHVARAGRTLGIESGL